MFVEGKIDHEFLRILKEASFDVVWECKSKADAVRHGYSKEDYDKSDSDTIARFFIDSDIEEYLMPILITDLEEAAADRLHLLPLMAVCGNDRMRNWAELMLRMKEPNPNVEPRKRRRRVGRC
jgi:hypothetical protein